VASSALEVAAVAGEASLRCLEAPCSVETLLGLDLPFHSFENSTNMRTIQHLVLNYSYSSLG